MVDAAPDNPRELLNRKQAAGYLGMCERTFGDIWKALAAEFGLVPMRLNGRKWRITDLRAFLDKLQKRDWPVKLDHSTAPPRVRIGPRVYTRTGERVA